MELEVIRSTLYYYKYCSWPELCYIIKVLVKFNLNN